MVELIYTYFPNLSATQKQQLEAIGPLYADWNQKINVISRKDIDNFYEHHVLHSLAIAKVVDFKPGTKIIDIGTGGGFPGVPLAILFPETDFLLVDSVGKKLKVIDSVVESIGLSNVSTLHERVENVTGIFDFIVSRSVTRLDEAWNWTNKLISTDSNNDIANGMLYLKGGDVEAEKPAKANLRYWPLSDFYEQEYFSEKGLVHLYK